MKRVQVDGNEWFEVQFHDELVQAARTLKTEYIEKAENEPQWLDDETASNGIRPNPNYRNRFRPNVHPEKLTFTGPGWYTVYLERTYYTAMPRGRFLNNSVEYQEKIARLEKENAGLQELAEQRGSVTITASGGSKVSNIRVGGSMAQETKSPTPPKPPDGWMFNASDKDISGDPEIVKYFEGLTESQRSVFGEIVNQKGIWQYLFGRK